MTGDDSSKKRGLGMGLSALLGSETLAATPDEGIETVPVEFLQPSPLQPRQQFDENELATLAESVRSKGIIQPLVVRPKSGTVPGYEIIAGERRWRAAQRAGLHEVPVLVRHLSDIEVLEISLIENLQRQDLSAIEEAAAFQRLMAEFGHSQEQLAEAVGRSRSHIANTIRLLKLPEDVQTMISIRSLSAGHARALVTADDPEQLARQVVDQGLSVRQTEALANQARKQRTGRTEPSSVERDPNYVAAEKQMTDHLGLKVAIKPKRRGGTLVIHFRTPDQLEGVMARLGGIGSDQ